MEKYLPVTISFITCQLCLICRVHYDHVLQTFAKLMKISLEMEYNRLQVTKPDFEPLDQCPIHLVSGGETMARVPKVALENISIAL